jgi:hypothetical protein
MNYGKIVNTLNTRWVDRPILRGALLKKMLAAVLLVANSSSGAPAIDRTAQTLGAMQYGSRGFDTSGSHGLQFNDNDLFGNIIRSHAFDWERRVHNLRKPWDKSDWRFWPQYPTAYTENNQLIFTADMLAGAVLRYESRLRHQLRRARERDRS